MARIALVLRFHVVAHKGACHILPNAFLEVLFTQDSEVEDLFCGASSGVEPSLFLSNNLFSVGLEPVQDDFQHDLTWMTDEANGSVNLADLQVALLGRVIISD